MYVLNILICGMSKKEIELSRKNNIFLIVVFFALSDLTHMMSMTDLVAIMRETQRIDSECSLEKEFIELICMNP